MISAVFNLLCIGSFATFGLTCTLIHKLCCKRCGRRYPAIENVPCSCEKYTPPRESASVCTNTSNSFQKNNNRRRSSINDNRKNKPSQCCTRRLIPNSPHSNCNSDISVQSQNTSILQENSIKHQDDVSYTSKSAPTSITLSYNSDIFNQFTISSTNSDLPSNLNICINSCLNNCPAVCNVGQKESTNDPVARKDSCKNASTSTSEVFSESSTKQTNNNKFEPNHVSIGSSCCKCNKQNSIQDLLNSYSGNSENNSISLQTHSCCSCICSDTSELIDKFREKVQLDKIDENIDLCCILRPNSNLDQSGSTYEFSDSSNSAIINIMRPIYCKCGRKMDSDEDTISENYSIIQCEPKTNSLNYNESEDISTFDIINTEASGDISEVLDGSILSSISNNENRSMGSINSLQSNKTQSICEKNSDYSLISNNYKAMALDPRESTSQTTNAIKSTFCSNDCCENCDCASKPDENSFKYGFTSSNECNQALASRFRGSNASTINSYKNIKSTLCSSECQTDCCTKCSCAQTIIPKKCETTSQTIKTLPKLCSSECQTECCTNCNCATQATTSNFYKKMSQGQNTVKSTLCSNECQTECCTKCSCAQTTEQNDYRRKSASIKTCSDACQKICCTKCSCTQTIASEFQELKSETTNTIPSALCSSKCQTDCCTKCSCTQTLASEFHKKKSETENTIPFTSCSNMCQSECCTKCECAQSVNIYRNISDAVSKVLSTKYSSECDMSCCSKCSCAGSKKNRNTIKNTYDNECPTVCCSKCSCAQTAASNVYRKISEATDKILSTKWSSECADCCSKCSCTALEKIVTNSRPEHKVTICSNECPTNCCSKCSCAPTVASNVYRKISEATNKLLSTKWSDECTQNKNTTSRNACPTDCCPKCSCTPTVASNVYRKISDATNKILSRCVTCCSKCSCTESIESEKLYTNSQRKIKNTLCSNECQTECCTTCSCSQTAPTIINKKISVSTNCNSECTKNCCTKCNCTQTTASKKLCTNECQTDCCIKCTCTQTEKLQTLSASKSKICSNECQTDCCTKCNCTQTTETPNTGTCHKECQKNCCTKCNCAQTLGGINAKLQTTNRSKSNLCSHECQTECCTKCDCTQTAKPTTTSKSNKECCTKCNCAQITNSIVSNCTKNITSKMLDPNRKKNTSCSSECQTDCCTKCSCAQTLSSFSTKPKSNLCNSECQTECCTKCNCAQTTNSNNNKPITESINTGKCKKECQTDCCTKCNCAQTFSSISTKPKSNLCNSECQTDCCTKCTCAQTTNSNDKKPITETTNTSKCRKECQKNCCTKCKCAQALSSFDANSTKSKFCNDECQTECCTKCDCTQTTVTEHFDESPKSELSINNSKSSTTMTMKRRRVTRKCCNHLCTRNNDAVLVQGDIQIKEMPNGPIKYVFQTEESDNTIRVHELSLNIKQHASQVSLQNILGKYLLKLKVNS